MAKKIYSFNRLRSNQGKRDKGRQTYTHTYRKRERERKNGRSLLIKELESGTV